MNAQKKILAGLFSTFCLVSTAHAACPTGYESFVGGERQIPLCLCTSSNFVCTPEPLDFTPAPQLCSSAPTCSDSQEPGDQEPPDEEDPGDDDGGSSCGLFSYGDLLTLGAEDSEAVDNLTVFAKNFKGIVGNGKDPWLSRELEDSDAADELTDLISYILDPDEDEESLEDEFPPSDDPGDIDDGDDGDDEDDGGGEDSTLCYSIEDLLNDMVDNGCTKAQRKALKTVMPRLTKALKNSGPFVESGLEDEDSAKEMRSLLKKAKKACKYKG